jgi:hypothetical protein
MCRRCISGLLLGIGSVLVFFAVFPVLVFVHFGEPLQTGLMASKLLLLPVGALCLAGAAMLGNHEVRH